MNNSNVIVGFLAVTPVVACDFHRPLQQLRLQRALDLEFKITVTRWYSLCKCKPAPSLRNHLVADGLGNAWDEGKTA